MTKYNDNISYKIVENGYEIYLNDTLWITQYAPAIPYPELSYEESCKKQLDELTAPPTEVEVPDDGNTNTDNSTDKIAVLETKVTTLEDEVTTTQLALTEQYEENITLQEEITNTELALTEIYESML